MKVPDLVDGNPITPRVALRCFPLDVDRFTKVKPRIAGFAGRNRDLVFGSIVRRQVICDTSTGKKRYQR